MEWIQDSNFFHIILNSKKNFMCSANTVWNLNLQKICKNIWQNFCRCFFYKCNFESNLQLFLQLKFLQITLHIRPCEELSLIGPFCFDEVVSTHISLMTSHKNSLILEKASKQMRKEGGDDDNDDLKPPFVSKYRG